MGISYQLTQKKYNFTIGLAAQPYRLQGKSLSTSVRTDQSRFNFIPEARLFYQLTEGATLNFNYNALVHQPSFIQLQPVPDLSRPQYPVIGNPALEPTISHRISLSFHRFNRTTGHTLLANVAVTPTQNEIVTNVIDRSERQEENATIVQETRFLNTYGAISMNGTYSYTIPLAQKKYTLSFNGLVNYSNNISYVNSRRNQAGNVLFNQGVAIGAGLNSVWDAEVRVNYVTNQTAHAAAGTGASTHTFSLVCTGRHLPKNWELGYDLGHTTNQGFGGSVQSNPTIFNVYAEYRFFKNDWMRIRCSGLDLFNQNVGIVRSVSGNTLADVRSNRLSRYFLISLTAHLRKM